MRRIVTAVAVCIAMTGTAYGDCKEDITAA